MLRIQELTYLCVALFALFLLLCWTSQQAAENYDNICYACQPGYTGRYVMGSCAMNPGFTPWMPSRKECLLDPSKKPAWEGCKSGSDCQSKSCMKPIPIFPLGLCAPIPEDWDSGF